MKAKIIMIVDGEEYEYGTYPFESNEQKNHVNSIAIDVMKQRGCYTYVKEVN